MYISPGRICGLYRAGEPPTHAAVESVTNTLSLRECAPELARCLRSVRVATGRAALQTGLAMVLPVLICWLAITMPLDWVVELPRWARALFLVAGMGGAAWVGWYFGMREWLHRPSDEAVALTSRRRCRSFAAGLSRVCSSRGRATVHSSARCSPRRRILRARRDWMLW